MYHIYSLILYFFTRSDDKLPPLKVVLHEKHKMTDEINQTANIILKIPILNKFVSISP